MALQPVKRTRRRTWALVLLAGVGALLTYRALAITPMPEYAYLADKRPVILGHQGASAYAPSNTIESFKLALAQNADILELDVHKTLDGVIVVSHDDAIDRLTNGKGKIKEMTLAELRTYDFGYGFTADEGKTFPWRGKGVTVPKVHYWTIDDAPTMAHLIDIGADGIITDAPDIAYTVLKEKGLQ